MERMRINPVADMGEESLENVLKRLNKQHYCWLDRYEDEMDYWSERACVRACVRALG